MNVTVSCKNVSKTYAAISGSSFPALVDISLSVRAGEFVSIVGPSGSGKTTLLRIIAGISPPSSGSVTIGDSGPEPRIGMVFQGNSVFPWRTVQGNLSYSLEVRGLRHPERRSEAARLCQLVGLSPEMFLKKYPSELSGGETRRVAIAMALGAKVNLLLLDEPTSQIDYVAKLKIDLTVQDLWIEEKFTAIYVTHDIDEAILLGDRILILQAGHITNEIPVNLPRPRWVGTLASGEFARLREDILRRFEG